MNTIYHRSRTAPEGADKSVGFEGQSFYSAQSRFKLTVLNARRTIHRLRRVIFTRTIPNYTAGNSRQFSNSLFSRSFATGTPLALFPDQEDQV